MSAIDKFGRPLEGTRTGCGVGKRGPPGIGYQVDRKGNYTLNYKRLKLNVFDTIYDHEAVSLGILRNYTLHKLNPDGIIDANKSVIKNIIDTENNDPTSAVTKGYVDSRYPMSVKQDKRGYVLLCGNKRLTNVLEGINSDEAVNRQQVEEYAEAVRKKISEEIKEAAEQIKKLVASESSKEPNVPFIITPTRHKEKD